MTEPFEFEVPDDLSGLDDIPAKVLELDVGEADGTALFMATTTIGNAELLAAHTIARARHLLSDLPKDDVTVMLTAYVETVDVTGSPCHRQVMVTFNTIAPFQTWSVQIAPAEMDGEG